MNLDRRLLQFLGRVRWPLTASITGGLLAGLLTVTQAWYVSRIISGVFLQGQTLHDELNPLLLFTLASILQALLRWMSHVSGHTTAAKIQFDLRQELLSKLNQLGPVYTRDERSGELSNTILTGVDALEAYFSQYIPQLFFSSLIPITIVLFVFPNDLLSGFVMILTAPIIPIFMILIGHVAQSMTRKQWKTLSRMSAHFLDVLQGLTTLKLLNRSREEEHNIDRISDAFRESTMNVLKVAFLSALVLEMAATISTAVIAVEIGLRLLYAKMSFQPALFILILAPEFYQPMRQLGARFHAGMEGVTAAQRIFSILETPRIARPETISAPAAVPGKITFDHVSFTYAHSSLPAVHDLNFTLIPRSKTALVGASGSGKTTISQLLMKFLIPDEGAIFIDNRDLNTFDDDPWRKFIAWVPQQPYLFHQSIADNILLARPNATRQEMILASQQAGLDTFVQTLPEGYGTTIGEQGSLLSGGQAQRIALARAFLKDAPLLILDEPTAHLDPHLEAALHETIRNLSKDRTTLWIAHRLSTIRDADRILVLSKGQIIEQGTHSDLISKKGAYARLFQLAGGHLG